MIEQLGGHLEGYGSLVLFHGGFTLLFIIFCNEIGHVLTQCLPGRALEAETQAENGVESE